jgi:hypothetical protein
MMDLIYGEFYILEQDAISSDEIQQKFLMRSVLIFY